MTSADLKVYMVNFLASSMPEYTDQISFDSVERFHLYLRDSYDIAAYWNYIPLLYMIKTKLSARELAERFRPFLGSRFIVARIDKQDVDGQLPSEAWEWIYYPHHEKSKLAELMLPRANP